MGKDRYYYDRHGRYKGKSSDQGPYSWVGGLILLLIIIWLLNSC